MIYTLVLLTGLLAGSTATAQEALTDSFDELQKTLTKDGFDTEKIKALYDRSSVRFDPKSVSLFFMHSEGKLNYGQFETSKSVRQAKKYQQAHDDSLTRTEKKYGVDKEVITAILLVETRLGERLGKSLVFNTLSSMAALENKNKRQQLWQLIPENRRLTRERFEQKAEKKSGWAYRELKALIRYAFPHAFAALTPVPWGFVSLCRATSNGSPWMAMVTAASICSITMMPSPVWPT